MARISRTLGKYLLLQTPGFAGAAVVLFVAVRFFELPAWLGGVLLALWVAKDAALYPFLRIAYEPGPPGGAAALVGLVGRVTRELAPVGSVQVGAELYRAELRGTSGPLPVGADVRVVAVRGLTLLVEPWDGDVLNY